MNERLVATLLETGTLLVIIDLEAVLWRQEALADTHKYTIGHIVRPGRPEMKDQVLRVNQLALAVPDVGPAVVIGIPFADDDQFLRNGQAPELGWKDCVHCNLPTRGNEIQLGPAALLHLVTNIEYRLGPHPVLRLLLQQA